MASNRLKSEPFVRLYHLLRLLQQRNRFVSRLVESNVSLLESHFLLELQANPQHTLSSLTSLLGVDQSSVSRLGSKLQRAGYLRKVASSSDKRRTRLALSASGIRLIETIDRRADAIIDVLCQGISTAQFDEIVWLLRAIADGYGQPRSARRASERAFRAEQRRVTRALRLLGNSIHDTEFCSLDWQILVETTERSSRVTSGQLASMLSTPPGTVSAAIIRLEKQGYVRRFFGQHDRRTVVVEATKRGQTRAAEVESAAATRLENALGQLTSRLERALEALTDFVGDIARVNDFVPPDFAVREVIEELEIAQMRGFAIRKLVANRLEDSAPTAIFAKSSRVFALHNGGDLLAVFEVKKGGIVFGAWHEKIVSGYLQGAVQHISSMVGLPHAQSEARVMYAPLLNHLD